MGHQCREAYKALDIRNKQVTAGLGLAIKQHRQLLQDVSMADPKQARADHIMSEGIGGPGQCLDLSTHDAWASTSPLVGIRFLPQCNSAGVESTVPRTMGFY